MLKLKDLRSEKKLSLRQLANDLSLSYSSLNKYERGDQEPNLETLRKIADYFNVSTDYLIGLTEVRTLDLEISYMSEYLGLTEETINNLHYFCKQANLHDQRMRRWVATINILISSNIDILAHISDYLNFSATHFKKYNEDGKGKLIPIAELELWDDMEKISYSDDWDMWSEALLILIEKDLEYLRSVMLKEKREKRVQQDE